MTKVCICGGRDFLNYNLFKKKCDSILENITDIEIISGGASGADFLAEIYAEEKGYKMSRFPADWKKYKKRAGIIRNKEMIKQADFVIAYWNGVSKGTASSIKFTEQKGIPLRIIKY